MKLTAASVGGQALSAVAHKGFTEIADRPNHSHPSGESCVLNEAIATFGHALLFPALCANRKSLNGRTEVTEGPRFLFLFAFNAFHCQIT